MLVYQRVDEVVIPHFGVLLFVFFYSFLVFFIVVLFVSNYGALEFRCSQRIMGHYTMLMRD